MPPDRPYHHGHLRDALLDAAEQRIEADGADGLSMRGIARLVGVSHAAPAAHFADRRALLDALALRGFRRLGAALGEAHATGGEAYEERFRASLAAFVAFASEHGTLLGLMFATKGDAALRAEAEEALDVVGRLIDEGIELGVLAPDDRDRSWLVLAALTRGIAVLVATGNLGPEALDVLLTDATTTFLRGNAPR